MRMSIQRLSRPYLPLDLSQTKLFLRVNSDCEDVTIQALADAAAHEFEDAAEIALVNQMVRVTLEGWPDSNRLRLPIGPVTSDNSQFQVIANGEQIEADLITGNRPAIILSYTVTDTLRHARFVVEYEAGFGSTAEAFPPDIIHAIREQVALGFDFRGADVVEGKAGNQAHGIAGQSYAMRRVIGRYRGVKA